MDVDTAVRAPSAHRYRPTPGLTFQIESSPASPARSTNFHAMITPPRAASTAVHTQDCFHARTAAPAPSAIVNHPSPSVPATLKGPKVAQVMNDPTTNNTAPPRD